MQTQPAQLTKEEQSVLRIASDPKYQRKSGRIMWIQAINAGAINKAHVCWSGSKANKSQRTLKLLEKRGITPENFSRDGHANGAPVKSAEPSPTEAAMLQHTEKARIARIVHLQVEAMIGRIVNECHWCPRCGKDLEQSLRLAYMAEKMKG